MLRVIGINPGKTVADPSYSSAVMIPLQGSFSGDVARFECNLDSARPSMRRFELNGGRKVYTSSQYYFEEGILEVEPEHTLCLSILFWAEERSYEIAPELIVELGGVVESVAVPLKRRGVVCPNSLIPDEGKYVRTFSSTPSFVEVNCERFDSYLRQMRPSDDLG